MLALLIQVYSIVVLVRVVLSWVNPAPTHPAVRWVYALTEPVLEPIRKVLPAMGGFDFSPMVLLFGLQMLSHWF